MPEPIPLYATFEYYMLTGKDMHGLKSTHSPPFDAGIGIIVANN
jgi:hypothetical protein